MGAINFPAPGLSPVDVVESQLAALKAGDVSKFFRFSTPARQRSLGSLQHFETQQRSAPTLRPIFFCSRYAVIGGLALGESRYKCRVRVWPAGSSSAPFAVASPVLDYEWELALQGLEGAVVDSNYGDEGGRGLAEVKEIGPECWLVDSMQPGDSNSTTWDG